MTFSAAMLAEDIARQTAGCESPSLPIKSAFRAFKGPRLGFLLLHVSGAR